ncbi:LysR family transcriptional regulator [Verrucomicrobiaceae bacterium R5-34]|nr:LysR family transcriptional regulator [Verrucomicrobiaceae bacterium R5-34]
MNLSLKQLQHFTQIAEHQNISSAASTLGVTQPALSLSLKKIEKDLDIQLFHRTEGRVVLNEVGRLLQPKIKQLLRSYESVLDTAETIGSNHPPSCSVFLPSCPWTYDLRIRLAKDPAYQLALPTEETWGDTLSPAEHDAKLICEYTPKIPKAGYKHHLIHQIKGLCAVFNPDFEESETTAPTDTLPPHAEIVIPCDTCIPGIRQILQSEAAEKVGLTHRVVRDLACYDQIVASCLNPMTIGLLSGQASVWRKHYGDCLKFVDIDAFKDHELTTSLVCANHLDPQIVHELVNISRNSLAQIG